MRRSLSPVLAIVIAASLLCHCTLVSNNESGPDDELFRDDEGGGRISDAQAPNSPATNLSDAAPNSQPDHVQTPGPGDSDSPSSNDSIVQTDPNANACAAADATYEAELMQSSTGVAEPPGWNLWSNGWIATQHSFSAGRTTITVNAKGSPASGAWPNMVVQVGSKQIGSVIVSSSNYAAYSFTFDAVAATRDLRIAFTNDLRAPPEDRNLYVDRVVIDCSGSSVDGGSGNGAIDSGSGAGTNTRNANPFVATSLYVDQDFQCACKERELRNVGNKVEADLVRKIAGTPQADWILDSDAESQVRKSVGKAGSQMRVLVAYNMYRRDCGSYSSGGAASPDEYRQWINAFARGIGNAKVAVILEPDALSQDCEPTHADLVKYAVQALKKQPNAYAYIDAGNPGWLKPDDIAGRLRKAGVDVATGFAINVSNYFSNAESIGYGNAISSGIGDKPYVIDTSRNARGSAGTDQWCNPPGRGLGFQPTANTGDSHVHAFVWVKRPGESDGQCNGGPGAGHWFQSNALELARNALF